MMNAESVFDTALPMADIAKKSAITNKAGLRPYLSAGHPPNNAPANVPINADDIVNPCQNGERLNKDCIDFSTPEMTAVSNPNKNPPSETMTDQQRTVRFFLCINNK